jgi:hypothetical protein
MAGIRLSLNAMGVEQGKRDVLGAFNQIKTSAGSMANTVDSAVTRMGNSVKGAAGSFSTLTKNMDGRARFLFQNTANQLGDIAVQASMGTNIFRVLGMQLPQIAGAFSLLAGPVGVVAGVLGLVAAVGFPIIAMLTSMGNEGATTADKLDDLADVIDRLEGYNRKAGDSVVDLSRDYGILAERVRDAAGAVAELEAAEAGRQARNVAAEIGKQFGTVVMDEAEAAQDALSMGFSAMGNVASAALLQIQDDLALNEANAYDVAMAIDAVNRAATDEERSAALLAMAGVLNEVEPRTKEGAAAVLELATQAQSAGDQFARIVTLANQAAQNVRYLLSGDTAARMDRWANRSGTSDRTPMTNFGLENTNDNRPRRSGGMSAIDRERKELETFADRIKPVLSLLQEYEQNMEKLNRAKEIGAITAEEFATKEAILTQQFGIASGALADYTSTANVFADSLTNNMMALADGTLTVQDAFKSMATAVIKELYRVMVVQQAVNAIMGAFGYTMGAGGSYIKTPAPVPSMDGGGYTGSGARTGGLDGKGGFMAMLHPQETVVDHTKGQSSGVVVNQVINVSAGVSQTVRAEMMNLLPQFKQQATAGVLDAKRRGGSYGGAFA